MSDDYRSVTFTMSRKAMFHNGWVDGEPNTGHPDIDAIIRAATFHKSGRGGFYAFACDWEQAQYIERTTRTLGDALAMEGGSAGRDGRELIAAADKIRDALALAAH